MQARAQEHYFHAGTPVGTAIASELEDASKAFVHWRYIHENGFLSAKPLILKRIGTALHKTTRELAPDLVSVFEA